MRYVAISLATLAVIAGVAAVAFVFLGRSLNELSPQRQRLWEQGWTGAAHRLLAVAVGLFLVAVLLFALSFA
jgi:lysylphosphatidylglycerol synthetase-like protein (DUF2156 family)